METLGIFILVATIINTINLIIKNKDIYSIFAIVGLFCFAIIGIIETHLK